ncbi:MAG TPA: M2 family metallopeptidase, partial [Gemmatimonadales bacterium]|nr:M2 family metallopeptidase [Gemmatimonadales bacterium]
MRHSLRWLGVAFSLVTCTAASLPAQAARLRAAPTAAEARRFMDSVETRLAELARKAQQAEWVNQTYITYDTERLAADAKQEVGMAVQRAATAARRYERVKLDPELARKFTLLKLSLAAPPPADPKEAAEMTALQTGIQGDYGRGTYCKRRGGKPAADSAASCLQINELSRILAESHNPAELLEAWQGWHRVGAPMRERYARFVELANKGARGIGFKDAGAMWRSGYDMPPEAFAAETERLWQQVKPLYVALHAYVRSRLAERYGSQVVPANGLIPAHLLGNMWAQEWGNIYPLVAPAGGAPTYDVTQLLKQKQVDQYQMVRYGERFFTSLGFDSLPGTFWQRSMIVKPRDRDVVCHASAWDVDDMNDLRIKMCTEVTGEDFVTVHHELGHNFYQRAYNQQPPLF